MNRMQIKGKIKNPAPKPKANLNATGCSISHIFLGSVREVMKNENPTIVDISGESITDYFEAVGAVVTHKSPPKGYPDSKTKYADPKNFKYPVDTEAHVRAAWSYIHMPKNRKGYTPAEVSAIEGRIKSAGKKFNIDFSK